MSADAKARAAALIKKHAALEKRSGGKCSVRRSGQLELINALIATGKTATFIAAILRKEGLAITDDTIRRHAAGACVACAR